MNKESIYRIIGYHGEYNTAVKKAIRKLLKENHPDNNGDRKVFELINEVKKELEENRVSFDYKKIKTKLKKDEDIDYSYCIKMMNSINEDIKVYTKELDIKKKELANSISNYKDFYKDSIDLETYLLSNTKNMNKLNSIKTFSVILLIMAIIAFTVSILTKNIIILGIFIVLALICVIIIHKAFFVMQKIAEGNRSKIKKYVGVNGKLRNNQSKQEELKKEIHDIKKKITNLENDLRFYNNLLK
jgi:hypothetical protein